MRTVTPDEFASDYDRLKVAAARERLAIGDSEYPDLIILTPSEYERLRSLDDRVVLHPSELSDDMKVALGGLIADLEEEQTVPAIQTSPA